MRSTRMFSAIVALVLAVTMPLLGTGMAEAKAKAKPKHDLTAEGREVRDTGRFYVKGKVTTFKNRRLIVQRKLPGKSFKLYKKTKTKNNGKFRTSIDGPRGTCFKVVVPATRNYRVTKDHIGCIVKE